MVPACKREPARVNPVVENPAERRVALEGDWRFRLDPDDVGVGDEWYRRPDHIAAPIAVPGCWQGQGFGGDGEDEVWDFRLRARVFRATYRGTGWYARTLRVPGEWVGQRLWLNFGGVHPSAEVWLNGEAVGRHDLPFVPFGFEVGDLLRPEADNDLIVRVSEHHRLYGLAYNWQGNWSGLYRAVELTATGPACLDRVHLRPEVSGRVLRLNARIGGGVEALGQMALRVTVTSPGGAAAEEAEIPVAVGEASADIPVPDPILWSPDAPNLYRVDVELVAAGAVLDALSERTGFLELGADGGRFLVNGEPYYIRGTGDFLSCPETGCPDTDRDRWRRKLKALRDYGYNQVRCQSYVYTPEYYDVADEVGLLVQGEMGMLGAWGGQTEQHVYAWPAPTPDHYPVLKRQWDLVVERDLNHPSACIYCMSNELPNETLFPRTAWSCYHDTRALKPNAFVIWTDGGYSPDLPGDFINANWPQDQPPPDKPVIEHEFRWWSSFPDVRLSRSYDGAVRPYAAEIASATARDRDQEHLLEAYAESSRHLQLLEMKAKLEQLRHDRPFLAGISHFNAMDTGPSPQGVITEFYHRKLADPQTWLQTNGDTVILAGLGFEDRALAGGGAFACSLSVSDFSHPPYGHPRLTWHLSSGAEDIAAGELSWDHRAYTTCPVGEVQAALPEVDAPLPLRLSAKLTEGGRAVSNCWDLWLFPAEVSLPAQVVRREGGGHSWIAGWDELPVVAGDWSPDCVLLTERLDEAVLDFLRAGGRAILATGEGLVRPHRPNFGYVRYFFTPPANYGPYEDGQNGTLIRRHALLGDFPHDGHASWPFFRTIEHSPPLDLEPLGLHDEDPIVRVIHRYPVLHPLGYLLERSVGAGRLVLTAFDLDPKWPEARYLLGAMCSYLKGSNLTPAREASETTISRLLAANREG